MNHIPQPQPQFPPIINQSTVPLHVQVAVIGGGPAGLMAAETLQAAGLSVHLFDAMPSVGRKFLLAGKGGLNLTHSEPLGIFTTRFGKSTAAIEPLLAELDAEALRAWALGLGIETFVGSSGRVFPQDMKAAPLLRAWLQRLRHPTQGPAVQFHMRHRWVDWAVAPNTLVLKSPHGYVTVQAQATVFALGGASWARLGSDGAWVSCLQEKGVGVAPLVPSNCGFDVAGGWTPFFKDKFAGHPFKSVAISLRLHDGEVWRRKGEFVATESGVEGSLIYAASAFLRDSIAHSGEATFSLDLLPDTPLEKVLLEVQHPRGSRSLSSHLKSRLHIDGIKSAILHECIPKSDWADPQKIAQAIKALPISLQSTRPIDEAISTAGGVRFEGLNADLMTQIPGIFCAGEMLDWEAPTGGYLLNASMASGKRAGQGVVRFLER